MQDKEIAEVLAGANGMSGIFKAVQDMLPECLTDDHCHSQYGGKI